MRLPSFFITAIVSAFILVSVPAFAKDGTHSGSGEVVTVDPVYGQITIHHGAIKDFAGDEETQFFVDSPDMLKGLGRHDLVEFTVVEKKGDTRIQKIKKTGIAAPAEKEGLGKVVQDVLVGTGEVAKTVTSPIQPAHEVVSGAVGATTDATGAVLKDADNNSKQDF